MAYDRELAARLRAYVDGEPGLTERAMFGGLAFLLDGNMAVAAASQGGLLLRCAPEQTDELCEDAAAEPFVMRNRPMTGWLRIDPSGLDSDAELARWADVGLTHARSLPPK